MSRSTYLASTVLLLLSGSASAHFKLNSPQSLANQDQLGGPQKSVPCGENDGGFVLTNDVTDIQTGSMVSISVTETIFHPGHFRVLLAQDRASLPADPTVMPGSTACGSLAIDPNPQMPLIGDGLLVHTSTLPNPSMMQVQLPAGMECQNCVLQVVQFMSNHGAPCFYHHCATVNISNTAPPPPDAGVTPGDDAGTTGGDDAGASGGCCSTGGGGATGLLGGLAFLGLVLRRRR